MDVRLTVTEVVEASAMGKAAFPDQPERMGRIEGEVGGKRYAAMVPPSMIGDEQMCKAYLRHMATTAEPAYRYAVIRPAPDLPAGFLPDDWNGKWINLPTSGGAYSQPGIRHTVFGAEAVATDRFERREDGATARVYEVRP